MNNTQNAGSVPTSIDDFKDALVKLAVGGGKLWRLEETNWYVDWLKRAMQEIQTGNWTWGVEVLESGRLLATYHLLSNTRLQVEAATRKDLIDECRLTRNVWLARVRGSAL